MEGHAERRRSAAAVCVTGAGGYCASWLVKLLLARGYAVHGAVRDLSDKKTAHLKKLENASENLKLFKADLLDYDSLEAALVGCQGVFHVASPVPLERVTDPELEVLAPAVNGTINVLKAASATNVQRVVVVSSIVAVEIHPKDWPKHKIKDESCWSDKEFCWREENWYPVSKITAEKTALQYGHHTGLDVVTVNPGLVLGPMLQPLVNASSQFLVYLLKGGPDPVRNKLWHVVDVRDLAGALLLVYETAEASGRHICAPHIVSVRDLLGLLKSMHPEYPCLSEDSVRDMDHAAPMTSEKLKKLGWGCRALKATLSDAVEFFRRAGLLDDVEGVPCHFPPLFNKI